MSNKKLTRNATEIIRQENQKVPNDNQEDLFKELVKIESMINVGKMMVKNQKMISKINKYQ